MGDGLAELILVKVDSMSDNDASALASDFQTRTGADHIDIVIANAAVQNHIYSPLAQVDIGQVEKHLAVNTIGPLKLFQAMLPLLQKSSNPKFVLLGSPMGSISGMEARPMPMGAYGVSKAAAHHLVRKIHFENEGLIAFAVDPG